MLKVANPNFLLTAEDGIAEVEFEIEAQIITAHRAIAPPRTTSPRWPPKSAKKALEDVSKATHVAHVAEAPRAAHPSASDPGFSKAIVAGAGFGFRQDFVGFIDLLKGFLSPRFFVHIGVIFASHAAIGAL